MKHCPATHLFGAGLSFMMRDAVYGVRCAEYRTLNTEYRAEGEMGFDYLFSILHCGLSLDTVLAEGKAVP